MVTKHRLTEEGDSTYFMSMTDMMAGLLFIFIIMFAYFATQLRVEEATAAEKVLLDKEEAVQGYIKDQRARFLNDLKTGLSREGIEVEIDHEQGILRLPEELLFGPGIFTFDARPDVQVTLRKLAKALVSILPCYTYTLGKDGNQSRDQCKSGHALIAAILVEGHADRDAVANLGSGIDSNLKLSARRAINTYEALITFEPKLKEYLGSPPESYPVISVSAFGDTRPIDTGYGLDEKKKNRRIDLRVIMHDQLSSDGEEIFNQINRSLLSRN